MKKNLILAAAVLAAMTACTKNELAQTADKEISFQAAKYMVQTKANSAFPSDKVFGTYAWYDAEAGGDQHQLFMNNETVSFVTAENAWKASRTYYWPKTGTVDFFSYYPQSATPWLTLADAEGGKANKISATQTIAGTEDYMYADKACGYSDNNSAKYKISVNTDGVPTLFHHALAKVSVNISATKLQNDESTPTVRWEITLDAANFDRIYKSGSVVMNLDAAGTTPCTAAWAPPANSVWTPSDNGSAINCDKQTLPYAVTKTATDILTEYSVLPQALTGTDNTSGQVLHVKLTIKSYNKANAEDQTLTNLFATETIERYYNLKEEMGTPKIEYWKMNTKITYSIIVDPSMAEIHFDPAIADWETTSGSVNVVPNPTPTE